MIHIYGITKDHVLLEEMAWQNLKDEHIKYYWMDFDVPTEEETNLLNDYFHFHPLAIEDCKHFVQRPNMNSYDNVLFFILHSLDSNNINCEEVDIFLSDRFIVSFHKEKSSAIEQVKKHLTHLENMEKVEPIYILHNIIDELVDMYFPIMNKIEDKLIEIEDHEDKRNHLIEDIYKIRKELFRIRRTIFPMRDLLYRITNSKRIQDTGHYQNYFADIYDHLMKLSDMLVSIQDITNDMRENYMSIQSNKMNNIMMTLTVITTIFMPLSFLAGIYGMNFVNMPELKWKYGYYILLSIMLLIGVIMTKMFIKKGWLFQKDK